MAQVPTRCKNWPQLPLAKRPSCRHHLQTSLTPSPPYPSRRQAQVRSLHPLAQRAPLVAQGAPLQARVAFAALCRPTAVPAILGAVQTGLWIRAAAEAPEMSARAEMEERGVSEAASARAPAKAAAAWARTDVNSNHRRTSCKRSSRRLGLHSQ